MRSHSNYLSINVILVSLFENMSARMNTINIMYLTPCHH
jgi:hypothetical protein